PISDASRSAPPNAKAQDPGPSPKYLLASRVTSKGEASKSEPDSAPVANAKPSQSVEEVAPTARATDSTLARPTNTDSAPATKKTESASARPKAKIPSKLQIPQSSKTEVELGY